MFEIIMSIPISYFSFLGCNTRVSMVVIPGDVSNDPSCSENKKDMDEETYPQSQVGISLLKQGVSFNKMRIILASYGWKHLSILKNMQIAKRASALGFRTSIGMKHWRQFPCIATLKSPIFQMF